eukprot:gnl/Dysnectes_brevis/2542_a3060_1164.p1 GENE.gnl/Dysnectes_brevis/2542_a3060_1164~~gnl/Dysnectes_brevis/2542_a3060_1164.p1  ORF type:complete len:385 (+),score=126.67 gnl/Dysnectes_brevis/2542_a3060_1164:165-1319(+)
MSTTRQSTNPLPVYTKMAWEVVREKEDALVLHLEKYCSDDKVDLATRVAEYLKSLVNHYSSLHILPLIRFMKQKGKMLQSIAPQELIVGNVVRRAIALAKEDYTARLQGDFATPGKDLTSVISDAGKHQDFEKPLEVMRDIIQHLEEYIQEIKGSCHDAKTFHRQLKARNQIAKQSSLWMVREFIVERSVILTSGYSPAVREFLIEAHLQGKNFEVVVCQRAPFLDGRKMARELADNKLQVTLVPDSAIYSFSRRASMVLLEPYVVLLNGGVMGQGGHAVMASAATERRIPVIMLASSYQLSPVYPHNPAMLTPLGHPELALPGGHNFDDFGDIDVVVPLRDYIPPALVDTIIIGSVSHKPDHMFRMIHEQYDQADFDLTLGEE